VHTDCTGHRAPGLLSRAFGTQLPVRRGTPPPRTQSRGSGPAQVLPSQSANLFGVVEHAEPGFGLAGSGALLLGAACAQRPATHTHGRVQRIVNGQTLSAKLRTHGHLPVRAGRIRYDHLTSRCAAEQIPPLNTGRFVTTTCRAGAGQATSVALRLVPQAEASPTATIAPRATAAATLNLGVNRTDGSHAQRDGHAATARWHHVERAMCPCAPHRQRKRRDGQPRAGARRR
jgi:hypothetical protein